MIFLITVLELNQFFSFLQHAFENTFSIICIVYMANVDNIITMM